ncbi:hypothetical protein DPMN_055484 [Dreissena polymorpha]|uniref:Uncharacterized protein n=1 Tax=Dreissena polymorpha TaxID=45954 RepID=A0A9D4CQV7_DREPO|nr:hypothetical protein DPMN_055484 [Dreissena polymorpha]
MTPIDFQVTRVLKLDMKVGQNYFKLGGRARLSEVADLSSRKAWSEVGFVSRVTEKRTTFDDVGLCRNGNKNNNIKKNINNNYYCYRYHYHHHYHTTTATEETFNDKLYVQG